eukprot:scaffold152315_cov30-Tisochrysis_lutea.AAC.3
MQMIQSVLEADVGGESAAAIVNEDSRMVMSMRCKNADMRLQLPSAGGPVGQPHYLPFGMSEEALTPPTPQWARAASRTPMPAMGLPSN